MKSCCKRGTGLSAVPRLSASGRFLICLWLIASLAACDNADIAPPVSDAPRNVLFVGNSFTYYNNSLHNHYEDLVKSSRPDGVAQLRTRSMTLSGGRLPEHRAGLRNMLESGQWDVVVLQGHSRGPIEEEAGDRFREAAREYSREIRAHGARPVYFMTWAYADRPEMTAQLAAAYIAIGRETDAQVVPVGLAFATVTEEHPDIELRLADRRHPSLAGTYLAACTFYAVLQQASPEGIAYTGGLNDDIAAYLQRIAWQTVQRYQSNQ